MLLPAARDSGSLPIAFGLPTFWQFFFWREAGVFRAGCYSLEVCGILALSQCCCINASYSVVDVTQGHRLALIRHKLVDNVGLLTIAAILAAVTGCLC